MKPSSLTIRPAGPRDQDAVVALWRVCELVVSYNDPDADFRFAGHDRSVRNPKRTVNATSAICLIYSYL